jgi:hypothetical protein
MKEPLRVKSRLRRGRRRRGGRLGRSGRASWGSAVARRSSAGRRGSTSRRSAAATAAAIAAAATTATVTMVAVATTAVATTVATAAAVTGHCLVSAADEGDADDREKHRDAENQCSIHPRILQTSSNLAYQTQLNCRRTLSPCLGRPPSKGAPPNGLSLCVGWRNPLGCPVSFVDYANQRDCTD